MRNLTSIIRSGKTALAVVAMFGVTTPSWAQITEKSFAAILDKFVQIPADSTAEPEAEMLAKTRLAVNFMKRMELPQASQSINEALQLAPRNSQLHFLNGFIYQLQARQGDTPKNDMAIEGYQQALRLEPGNWIAQEFLGLVYLDYKKFDEAKTQFSEVLLMAPDSTISIHGMMLASYQTGDAVTACAMADQYRKVSPEPSVAFIRSSVTAYAACRNFDQADKMREALVALNGERPDVERADRRLAQWKSFYRKQEMANNAGGELSHTSLKSGAMKTNFPQLAQAFAVPKINVPATGGATRAGNHAEPGAAKAEMPADRQNVPDNTNEGGLRMVLVDVVLISTQELISTSKGINLLNALTLQLGSVTGNVPAYSRVRSSNSVNNAAATVSTAITRAVTVPALSYSLNIANANNSVNEILARPTLAAMEGLPSEFFSGTNLSAGVVSTSVQGGTTIVPLDKRFGIKLAVTPAFLSNGKVQLKVEAQRTSLNATADNPKVAYQIEIAEITANANVVMHLGDTLVLSGLSEKSSASIRDGVPVLQDVPIVQYLFSNKKTNDIQRSVLILITPRSAAYTATADPGQNTAMNGNIKALREKFGLSSNAANVEAALSQLKTNELFREFRQGDVVMERWDRMDTTGNRLRQALDFLYY